MNRHAQYVVLVLLGTTVARTAGSDVSLRYVKAGMQPWLLASGLILLALGLLSALRAFRPVPHRHGAEGGHGDDADHGDDDGHGHGGMTKASWVLLAPVLCLLLVAPPALGAYSAERARRVDVSNEVLDSGFAPLPPGDVVPLGLIEYSSRSLWGGKATLEGRSVALTGFVAPDPRGQEGSVLLSRMVLNCCAADASVIQVRVLGAGTLAADSWVEVVGTFAPSVDDDDEVLAVLQAENVRAVPAPAEPYE